MLVVMWRSPGVSDGECDGVLGKWWEARGGTSVHFPWRERLGLGESVS